MPSLLSPIRLLNGYLGFKEEATWGATGAPTHFVYAIDDPDVRVAVDRPEIPTNEGILRLRSPLRGRKRWEGTLRFPIFYGGYRPIFRKIFGRTASIDTELGAMTGRWSHEWFIDPAQPENVDKGLTVETAFNQTAAVGNALRYTGGKIQEARFVIEAGTVVFLELDMIGEDVLDVTPIVGPTFPTSANFGGFIETFNQGSVGTLQIDLSGGESYTTAFDCRRMIYRVSPGIGGNEGLLGTEFIHEPLRTSVVRTSWEVDIHAKAVNVSQILAKQRDGTNISMRLTMEGAIMGASDRFQFRVTLPRAHILEGADPKYSLADGLALWTLSGVATWAETGTALANADAVLRIQNLDANDDYV